jgi:hypothetical protein
VRGGGDADDALKTVLRKAEAQRRHGSCSSEAAAPPCLVQLEASLDLVRFRPISECIEADVADPSAGGLVESRPRAKPVHELWPHAASASLAMRSGGRFRPPLGGSSSRFGASPRACGALPGIIRR